MTIKDNINLHFEQFYNSKDIENLSKNKAKLLNYLNEIYFWKIPKEISVMMLKIFNNTFDIYVENFIPNSKNIFFSQVEILRKVLIDEF